VRRSLSRSLYLLLALLVFMWGTGYKLSLYRPPDNRVPAKLCTRSSDAAKSAVDDAAHGGETHLEPPLLTLAPVPVATLPVLLRRDRQDSSTKNASPFRWTPDLYLRPPPAQPRAIA
jgi:predicted small lipoprotein YifL